MRRAGGAVAFLALVARAFASHPSANAAAATARRAPVPAPRILVRATVDDRARSRMPVALWTRFALAYAGPASEPLPDDATADAAGCRSAGGDYLVTAAFDVRDDLPGMPNASDRLPGRARVIVADCADSRALADRAIRIDGDPVPAAEAGTVEALDDAWKRAAPAGLAETGIAIARIARVHRLDAGGGRADVYVLLGSVPPHALLADVMTATRSPRKPPLRLAVVRSTPAVVQAIFAQTRDGDPAPAAGDVLEYVPAAAPGAT